MLISESGCCKTNLQWANSADQCVRRPKVASHQSLSYLLTVKHLISRSTTGVNNNSPAHYDQKCSDDRMFIPHRRFNSLRLFCWDGREGSISDMIQLQTALILIRLFQRAVKSGSMPQSNECKGTNVSIDNFNCAL